MSGPPRFKDALEVFARHRVDLIVVGGVAAVIGGAPMATFYLKEEAGRDKDRAVLDLLRRALRGSTPTEPQ